MEERVRMCASCGSVVGWFAQFCEACGTRQAVAVETPPARPEGDAASAGDGGSGAAPAEARTAAKELFRAQLRLMHQVSEKAETLLVDLRQVRSDLAGARRLRRAGERRERLAALSERLLVAEGTWDEIQRHYNRESESAEEEWQGVGEGAQVDAYLTPAEEDAVGGEFSALQQKFEASEAELRALGRELSLARRQAESRLFGVEAASPAVLWGAITVAILLLGLSYAALRRGLRPEAALAPAGVAVLSLAVVAARRG